MKQTWSGRKPARKLETLSKLESRSSTSLVVATWLIFPFWEWVLIISFKWCAIKTIQEPFISFCLGYSILWAYLAKALFGSCACCVQKQYPRTVAVLQVMAWNVSAAAFHLQQKERRRRHGTILFLTTLHSVCVSLFPPLLPQMTGRRQLLVCLLALLAAWPFRSDFDRKCKDFVLCKTGITPPRRYKPNIIFCHYLCPLNLWESCWNAIMVKGTCLCLEKDPTDSDISSNSTYCKKT